MRDEKEGKVEQKNMRVQRRYWIAKEKRSIMVTLLATFATCLNVVINLLH